MGVDTDTLRAKAASLLRENDLPYAAARMREAADEIDALREDVGRMRASAINWTRYDGTPETLPNDGATVLLWPGSSRFVTYAKWSAFSGRWFYGAQCRPATGKDWWAPWPQAPEVAG